MIIKKGFIVLFLILSINIYSQNSIAAECKTEVGKLASAQGKIEIIRGVTEEWKPIQVDESLCQGDTIRAGENSRATLSLVNNAVLRVGQNTTMRLVDITGKQEESSTLELIRGIFQSFSRKPSDMSVDTPYLNGVIEGTEYVMQVVDGESRLTVLEGKVVAKNSLGEIAVAAGKSVSAKEGQAPQERILINPRAEVQWALYYPDVLTTSDSNLSKAAELLSVGQVDEASKIIGNVIASNANNGQAYALRAIVALVQNNNENAFTDASKAIELDTSTPAGSIALSYVFQSMFKIEQAHDTLAAASLKFKDDALVWARLAELKLMSGKRSEAVSAAKKAQSLAPDLSLTQRVMGFTELASLDSSDAFSAFEKAIQLDSSDPLAHLGLGLALISNGKLAEGRREIEIAVALDGSSALMRSYLGKAYYEEKRSPLDAQQYDIAMQLDPNDPTAFLYSGISKQNANRPLEALQDFEKSIELNDNRAVYRSRQLLDQDHASRGASLARAFNEAGFTEQGVAEASKSLSLDPGNASAHRFLSDVHQTQRRHEIARVSELFQAQMLQPLNNNPIQPSSTVTNLNILSSGGPGSVGYNEFTPLFQQKRINWSLANEAGSNKTSNNEIAINVLDEKVSFGFSALKFKTDGWRENNALTQDVYNGFVQYSPTEKFSAQAEITNRKSTAGDLAFNFDPTDFIANKSDARDIDNRRIGMRYSFSPKTHVLLSYIDSKQKIDQQEIREINGVLDPPAPPIPFVLTSTLDSAVEIDAQQADLQAITSIGGTNLVTGLNAAKSDFSEDTKLSLIHSLAGDISPPPSPGSRLSTESQNAYVYASTNLTPVTFTYGASYTNYELPGYKKDYLNPKLGMQLDISSRTSLRVAAFQVIKPVLSNNRTLEPTQIAGFNQLFDDVNGTKSQRVSAGFDAALNESLAVGIELTRRNLSEPVLNSGSGEWMVEGRKEFLHKLYSDWNIGNQISVHAALIYDEYKSDAGISTDDVVPIKSVTRSAPVSINFFTSKGIFAGIGATYVSQTVSRAATSPKVGGSDSFTVLDAVLGIRLPKQFGALSLAVKNLLDTEFNYQDDSYREFRDEPATGPYFPERILMARVVINI